MFIVLLRFSGARARAAGLMEAHRQWLARGFRDGVFLLAGSLRDGAGGGIVAHGASLQALQARVDADPFVAEGVVSAEIVEIAPARADARLSFLLQGTPAHSGDQAR